MGALIAAWNVPLALPSSTLTVPLPVFATAMSSKESLLKSAVAMAWGSVPAA